MAWGLTANLSHDERQNVVGEFFMKEMKTIFDSYNATDEADEPPKGEPRKLGGKKEREQKEEKEKQFVESTIIALSKATRNLGLARDSHVVYLQSMALKYNKRKEYLDEISSFSSFSPEGLLPKIITFVGGGSILTLVTQAGDLAKLLELPSGISAIHVVIFIVLGIMAMTAGTFGVKWWKNRDLDRDEKEIIEKSCKYWKNEVRDTFTECLFLLYKDMRIIMKEFDASYTETDFITDRGNDDESARRVIKEEILHPEIIEYHSPLVGFVQPPAKEKKDDKKEASKEKEEKKE